MLTSRNARRGAGLRAVGALGRKTTSAQAGKTTSASISVDNPKTHEKTTGYAQDNFSADNSDDPQGFAQVRPRPQDNFSAPSG